MSCNIITFVSIFVAVLVVDKALLIWVCSRILIEYIISAHIQIYSTDTIFVCICVGRLTDGKELDGREVD